MANHDFSRIKLLTREQLYNLPKPEWLIDGVLHANATGMLYGQSGCGKTFVALSMAASIAAGHDWCGRKTKAGKVLYVAAEGLFGLGDRLQAYEQKYRITTDHIQFSDGAFNLLNPVDMEKLADVIQASGFHPDLIILDTQARLTPGADENSAQDMGRVVAAVDKLRRPFNATALIVHHTGKDGKDERGSSAIRGAADLMMKCSRDKKTGVVTLDCDKMKDADQFVPIKFNLERVSLEGSKSSLAVTTLSDAVESEANQKKAHDALEELKGFGPGGATHTEWELAYIKASGKSEADFSRALRILKTRLAVRQSGKQYYCNFGNDGVGVNEVSPGCHDTSQEGVTSSPL